MIPMRGGDDQCRSSPPRMRLVLVGLCSGTLLNPRLGRDSAWRESVAWRAGAG